MKLKYYFFLHLIVIIFGFTGILGKEISIASEPLVFYRMLIAFIALLFYSLIAKKKFQFKSSSIKATVLTGLVVAAHWITFFEAIKQSNVSVALATMASTSFFVALLNPILNRTRLQVSEIALGIVAVVGLAMIFGFESKYKLGIFLALISSCLAALFTVINAKLIIKQSSFQISTIEMASGMVGVFLYLLITGGVDSQFFQLTGMDFLWLMLLGVLATAFAFLVSVEIMKELSPFTVALTVNLEPIYSIILALLIYGDSEKMSGGFYLGATLIVGAIFINTIFKKKLQRA